ncbi:MDR/zinc-dependent alcohol dehydrogenase-like family protein [Flavisphingomonas formosensis]|uniref:MDR/zinc-dependent alcohol dehydrogenase-like family protein n=1 Tax=Flavisphingomonas formosensis TaxID=861534 RepID=UPI0018E04699|nr:zinc-binding dehydrogenase [Sphingomonas formosensis]
MTSPVMRAAVVTAPGRVELVHIPVPSTGVGQVRVRLEGCGVCASNLAPWAGPDWMRFPTAPGALGHEGWGIVDEVGEGVDAIRIGQRVATLSHNSYAEFDVAEQSAVVPLPDALARAPFPGEPLGCAMNIFLRSEILPGQTVCIIGIGFLGALLTRLASEAGARVIAISRRDSSLALARRFGATETIRMDEHFHIIDTVNALTGGHLCERVIEAVGKQWPLDLAGELTAERGRLILAGYHQDGPRQVNMQLWNWRGLDVVNAHERDPTSYADGTARAVDAVVAGRFDPSPLYTHDFPLDRLGEALDMTRDHPEGFVKALIRLS